ncbi:hypothetical protein A2774_01565 [Candidatus Roizmanbacteria bacterium RIFCSPHIGHO2_01_FULL_39_12c]|uniref:GxxExxY protein n=1 Tax=Candidatus Roizmanbacteria bacterium RIFCSPHIGHO2_01_FULL_39_12c TaxID=1802031 RepID=A0A1F7G8F6_9BACT|nr:MAG: hypothetical protein A2774_01565 [Candidatus Roizmanbacteria bacterium RIFCSPHIGHO2_01_FULL_39_12c]OGK46591.1 MAG: hypothetical protein A2963_02570 [Candidatus Roizmanbacteria bacterium RIFCSPLOWO2_01_FULL_40_13]
MGKIIYPDLSYNLNGIFFKVHNYLGRYRNEQEYSDAIEEDLQKAQIKYEREKTLPASFQGEKEGRNKIDFIIEDSIILEIKAKRFLTREDYYQIKRYLTALNIKLGILVNFRDLRVNPKRILNSSGHI